MVKGRVAGTERWGWRCEQGWGRGQAMWVLILFVMELLLVGVEAVFVLAEQELARAQCQAGCGSAPQDCLRIATSSIWCFRHSPSFKLLVKWYGRICGTASRVGLTLLQMVTPGDQA